MDGFVHVPYFFNDLLVYQIQNEAKSISYKQLVKNNIIQIDYEDIDF